MSAEAERVRQSTVVYVDEADEKAFAGGKVEKAAMAYKGFFSTSDHRDDVCKKQASTARGIA
ncbi:MAG: hypothetical protein ABIT04_12445 [Novosphingobium sp.]